LEARRVDGHVMLTRIASQTLAALGLRAGQEVLSIDGLTPEEHVRRHVPLRMRFQTPQALDANTFGWALWRGELGSTMQLELRELDGTTHQVNVRRGPYANAEYRPVVEARVIAHGIGYLALSSFGDARAVALVDSALATFGDLRGLIVDTRWNTGGSQDAGWRVLSQFMDREFVQSAQFSSAYLGIWRAWGGLPPKVPMPARTIVPDPTKRRRYPMLWLIGPNTMSAAEGVAALVEQTGAGTTVGETTFGSTGQPLLIPVPGGGIARIRVEEERYMDGRIYTRRGIAPQVPIAPTLEGLRRGEDEVLIGALAFLKDRVGGPQRAISP